MRLMRLAVIDDVEHRATDGLGGADLGVGAGFTHRPADQLDGRLRVDLPMRDKQRAGLRVDEGAGQAR